MGQILGTHFGEALIKKITNEFNWKVVQSKYQSNLTNQD